MVTDGTAGICIAFSMFFFPSVRPEMFGGPRRKGKTQVGGRIDHLNRRSFAFFLLLSSRGRRVH